ncbi:hypothetical protein [uncultured Maribacter sp.]|uniref:hypothetical protein n=1 Tax=uncultured Maribacter sp. TaxID=431308 RepID=UPI002614A2D6|nr:hypothetical protein [uncultured Maribacter sp.]
MVKLNYNNLDVETQEKLLSTSKAEIEKRFGKDLKTHALENGLNFDELLNEEAIRNLYNYQFMFRL